ncbi:hypothetical protein SAMN05421780_10389 [Flexibacter flexilis DSM 6793]|uniref:Uncharacterized protein n=1 Tax=Flexibacter flexilis DSM 6793 TaxID=927664 RepID=A0A1I1GT85_9BACT|nr:hypothetical protein [Flexibacter flexilis]SFC15029.1 hypothetical protein SAMN05421780_10389 [Flexibacter flexilis DSM 6793]
MIDYQEKEVPFSPAELQKLKSERILAVVVAAIIWLVFMAVSIFLLINNDSGWAWLSVLLPAIIGFTFVYMLNSLNKDIAYGKKIQVSGVLADKTQRTTTSTSGTGKYAAAKSRTDYFLVIGPRKIQVELRVYAQYHVGEKLEIELTKYDNAILAHRLASTATRADFYRKIRR